MDEMNQQRDEPKKPVLNNLGDPGILPEVPRESNPDSSSDGVGFNMKNPRISKQNGTPSPVKKPQRHRGIGSLIVLGFCCIISMIIGGGVGFYVGKTLERERYEALQTKRIGQNENFQETLQDQLDRQKQIKEVKDNLEKLRQETYAKTEAIEKILAELNEIPDVEVIWNSRKFYGKELVKRTATVAYTDYSDPVNPKHKKEKIKFTLDHGTLFAPPEKALIKSSLPKELIMKAAAAEGADRMNVSGYLVNVSLYNVSAKIAKKAYLEKQKELEAEMPEKVKAYQEAVSNAEEKLIDLR